MFIGAPTWYYKGSVVNGAAIKYSFSHPIVRPVAANFTTVSQCTGYIDASMLPRCGSGLSCPTYLQIDLSGVAVDRLAIASGAFNALNGGAVVEVYVGNTISFVAGTMTGETGTNDFTFNQLFSSTPTRAPSGAPSTTLAPTFRPSDAIDSCLFAGDKLLPGKCLRSSNFRYALCFETNGEVTTKDLWLGRELWTNGANLVSAVSLEMKSDGNLMARGALIILSWSTGTSGSGFFVTIHNDGNVVIYNQQLVPQWSCSQEYDCPLFYPYAAPPTSIAELCGLSVPSVAPTKMPTISPSTRVPSISPTKTPTVSPSTRSPTIAPTTRTPTVAPSTRVPSISITPSVNPSTSTPSVIPTAAPTEIRFLNMTGCSILLMEIRLYKNGVQVQPAGYAHIPASGWSVASCFDGLDSTACTTACPGTIRIDITGVDVDSMVVTNSNSNSLNNVKVEYYSGGDHKSLYTFNGQSATYTVPIYFVAPSPMPTVVPSPRPTSFTIRPSTGSLESCLFAGWKLLPGDCLRSPNGRFSMCLEITGELTTNDLFDNNALLWTNGVVFSQPADLAMQTDGNLVAYAVGPIAKWATGTYTIGSSNYFVAIQDDGNVIVYNQQLVPKWRCSTEHRNTGACITFSPAITPTSIAQLCNNMPTIAPSPSPTVSLSPTVAPSTSLPTVAPSTTSPSVVPTINPTVSLAPSAAPTFVATYLSISGCGVQLAEIRLYYQGVQVYPAGYAHVPVSQFWPVDPCFDGLDSTECSTGCDGAIRIDITGIDVDEMVVVNRKDSYADRIVGLSVQYSVAASSLPMYTFTSTEAVYTIPVYNPFISVAPTFRPTARPSTPPPLTSIGSCLFTGSKLVPGQCLISPSRRYVMCFGSDGQITTYETTQRVTLWSNGNTAPQPDRLEMQPDGNLVIYGGLQFPWATATNTGSNYFLAMQNDANLVVYNQQLVPQWRCSTDHRFNGACVTFSPAVTPTSIADLCVNSPSVAPTFMPTSPTVEPSFQPTAPTVTPTVAPSTSSPTVVPTFAPSLADKYLRIAGCMLRLAEIRLYYQDVEVFPAHTVVPAVSWVDISPCFDGNNVTECQTDCSTYIRIDLNTVQVDKMVVTNRQDGSQNIGVQLKIYAGSESAVLFTFSQNKDTYVIPFHDPFVPTIAPTVMPSVFVDTCLFAGDSLLPGKCIKSPNRRFTMCYELDGLLTTNDLFTGQQLWNNDKRPPDPNRLEMQENGNLRVWGDVFAWWDTDTSGSNLFVTIQDDGNMVVYNQQLVVKWSCSAQESCPRVQPYNTPATSIADLCGNRPSAAPTRSPTTRPPTRSPTIAPTKAPVGPTRAPTVVVNMQVVRGLPLQEVANLRGSRNATFGKCFAMLGLLCLLLTLFYSKPQGLACACNSPLPHVSCCGVQIGGFCSE